LPRVISRQVILCLWFASFIITSEPCHVAALAHRMNKDGLPKMCCQSRCQILEFWGLLPMKWRRGELNPCPRRYPRKHLHVYPAKSSEEPSHAPAHCRLPSVHEIDSRTGAVAPPIRQPAVHVFAVSRRHCENVAIN